LLATGSCAEEPAASLLAKRYCALPSVPVLRSRGDRPMVSENGFKLRVEALSISFGGVQALSAVDLQVRDGELLAVIGPNGAGKTCLLNCINGFYKPQAGRVVFQGRDITARPTHAIAQLGLARVFQGIQLYSGLSTLDNIMAGRHIFMKHGLVASLCHFGKAKREEIAHRREVEKIIDFLEIQHIRKKLVGELPYGLRKRVDLGRALAMEPRLLLLDEPMAGMNLEEKEDMARFILDIHEEKKLTIILIEHDMGVVMDIAQRIAVLDFGEKIAEGSPEQVAKDPRVVAAYLGEEGMG
jgi:branched-chain amino acid transport system ATP-binding protein